MDPHISPHSRFIAYTATTRPITTIDSVAEDAHVWLVPFGRRDAARAEPGARSPQFRRRMVGGRHARVLQRFRPRQCPALFDDHRTRALYVVRYRPGRPNCGPGGRIGRLAVVHNDTAGFASGDISSPDRIE